MTPTGFDTLSLLDRIEYLEGRIRGDVLELLEMKSRYRREYAEAENAEGRAEHWKEA